MEAQTIDVSKMQWKKAADFPGNVQVKVLRDESERKERTLLVRLKAGDRVTQHSHLGPVQHYVLEGEYQSEGTAYPAGTYRVFPAKCDVPEITSRAGAVVLMIYDPVV
jgi:anti-sigma factor ChrR (cupin superfamily)